MKNFFAIAALALCGLPLVSQAAIINLDATSSTLGATTLNLSTGSYSIAIVGVAGGGLYDAWNSSLNPSTNNLWTDRFKISTGTSDLYVMANNPGYATASAALTAYQNNPLYDQNGSSLVQASNGIFPNVVTLTLTSPTAVTFSIPDSVGSNWDNTGGVSLSVTANAPEPGTLGMMGMALIGVGGVLRKKFQARS